MYVCVCKAVTDTTVRSRVVQGDDSVRAISRCTGLGTECGKCVGFARERISHHQAVESVQACKLS